MRVKPSKGMVMRDPRTMGRISPEGVLVLGHEPWVVRGLRDGDLEEMDAEADAPSEEHA